MSHTEIINPESDSIDAIVLVMCTFFVCTTSEDSKELRNKKLEAIYYVIIPKIEGLWDKEFRRFPTDEFGRDIIKTKVQENVLAITDELSESEDFIVLYDHVLNNIQRRDLQSFCIGLLLGMANAEDGADQNEKILLNHAYEYWGFDLSDKSSKEFEEHVNIIKKYKLGGMASKEDMEREKAVKKAGCFVATAVLQEPSHPSLVVLRNFRDIYLLNNVAGVKFVEWYYKHGPNAAEYISDKQILRISIKYFLVIPLSMFAGVLLALTRKR